MAAAGNGRQGPSLPAIGEGPTRGPYAPSTGYPCPHCGERTTVTDSRPGPFGWRRRRKCLSCRARFGTIEVVYTNELIAALKFRRLVLPRLEKLVRWAIALEENPEGDDEFDDFKDPR